MDPRPDLERKLAKGLIESQPQDAAAVLEQLAPEDASRVLAECPPQSIARVLERMVVGPAAAVLERLPLERAIPALSALDTDTAAAILRPAGAVARERLIEGLTPDRSRSLRSLLRYPEGTAAAVMDPDELALPDDLSVGEARSWLIRSADVVHYNVYVVDRERVLVGVLNVHELLIARPDEPLRAVMNEPTLRIPAQAGLEAIVSHPGWRRVTALPVVDAQGKFLGSVRYDTLRALEEQLEVGDGSRGNPTTRALGDLYRTGFAGLMEALLMTISPPQTWNEGRRAYGYRDSSVPRETRSDPD